MSVHAATGSNVKHLWVAANVKKICLKCQKFPNLSVLKLFQKLRENFFQNFLSKLTITYNGYFPDIYLKFYTVVPKNISKI